ncbi:MAG TPA: hypothetical protein VFV38_01580 [Ktedonobacteraceae bacterium]|nr:hypothetical protein [Ktedonobacteraceae bacterium]
MLRENPPDERPCREAWGKSRARYARRCQGHEEVGGYQAHSNAFGKAPWHRFWCPANVRPGTPAWTHEKRRDCFWGERKRFLASAEVRLFARNTCWRQERG